MADTTQGVVILDKHGNPMVHKPSQASMLAGNRGIAYDSASYDEHWGDDVPWLGAPDLEINPWRNTMVGRIRDQARNDGWASGLLTRTIDNVIGPTFRPVFKPHYLALAAYSGNRKFDASWAREFAAAAKANLSLWDAGGKYNDAERGQDLNQQFRLMFRHKLVEGDALGVMRWKPERIGLGRARYATCLQVIDPDRLSNPAQMFDMRRFRGGVELDDECLVAEAYHIRKAHPGEWFNQGDALTWERIERETEWGRPVVVHDFDKERAGQHRGVGILTPVLTKLKMLFKYDTAELDTALINAIFAAVIESPYDHGMLGDALDGSSVGPYQEGRTDFHNARNIHIGGSKVVPLYPGEKLTFPKAERPNANYDPFIKAVLRNASSAAGIGSTFVTNDWSDLNYSSWRGQMIEFRKTFDRRRGDFSKGAGQPIIYCFMEESMAVDDYPMPTGAVPDFNECRAAYGRCLWLGPPMGWLNPVDEPAGAILRMEGSLSTLEAEAAEQGKDIEELLDEIQAERAEFEKRNIPLPSWASAQGARDQIQPPKEGGPKE